MSEYQANMDGVRISVGDKTFDLSNECLVSLTSQFTNPEPPDRSIKETLEHLSDYEVCPISKKDCRFGLTEIKVPDHCPLRKTNITFSLVPLTAGDDDN